MSSGHYVDTVLARKKAPTISLYDHRINPIVNTVTDWAGNYLSSLKLSGSSAKGTAIVGVTDVDIFISLKSTTSESLKEIYEKLDRWLRGKWLETRKQDVSIGINYNGLKIDLVPGRIQEGYQNWHSLYTKKKDSWTQTNIDLHIQAVKQSGRQNEIMLTKIWRENHKLDFPSIYLELAVIEALKHRRITDTSINFLAVLEYLQNQLPTSRIVDPANSANIISDLLSVSEKQKIAQTAKESSNKTYWEGIIW